MRDEEQKKKWKQVVAFFKEQFDAGEEIDLDAMLFLIGVRELGTDKSKFKKDEKLDLMHIAICRLLAPYGFYELAGLDEQGWPHYHVLKPLPPLKAGEQALLMRDSIIQYFEFEGILEFEIN
jgi:hypothetical protein